MPTSFVIRMGSVVAKYRGFLLSEKGACDETREYQFFWMTQSPPAAFNPLHIFAALSADAKGPTRAR